MDTEKHDAHDHANAEFVALIRGAVRPLEPWTEADDDAPLADLRQVIPGGTVRGGAEGGVGARGTRCGVLPGQEKGDRNADRTSSLQGP